MKTLAKTIKLRLQAFKLDKASLKKGLIGFIIAFISFAIFSKHIHLIKSTTDSLPEHYFIQLIKLTPQKGDLTMVYNHWYKGKIIKRIIGITGDQITRDARGNIFINQQKIGRVCDYTDLKTGLTLTAIKSQTIPEGRVFLFSPHPQSFDSRYQEVGLVRVEDLEGKVLAIV